MSVKTNTEISDLAVGGPGLSFIGLFLFFHLDAKYQTDKLTWAMNGPRWPSMASMTPVWPLHGLMAYEVAIWGHRGSCMAHIIFVCLVLYMILF